MNRAPCGYRPNAGRKKDGRSELMATLVSGAHAETPTEARGSRAVRTQAF